jgi:hypothetical protein
MGGMHLACVGTGVAAENAGPVVLHMPIQPLLVWCRDAAVEDQMQERSERHSDHAPEDVSLELCF